MLMLTCKGFPARAASEEQQRQLISWREPECSMSDDGDGADYKLRGLLSAPDKTRDFHPETDKAECQMNPKDGE